MLWERIISGYRQYADNKNSFSYGGIPMTDLLYVGLTIAFLLLSWGFIAFCDRLMEDKK